MKQARKVPHLLLATLTWLVGVLGTTGNAGAQVFNYLSAPVDVTPGTAGSWVDVDVSAWVPAGATGVILQEVNPTATRREYAVRNNGSTDTWMASKDTSRQESLGFHMIGVDANRVFEVNTENTAVKTYLLGYTTAGVTFFTNAIDKSISATNTWTDVDISADTGGDTAIGAVFVVIETERVDHNVGLRMKGSTDEWYDSIDKGDAQVALIGVDSNEVAQMKIDSTVVDLYLVGYVTSGAVFFTNAVDKSTATTGSYVGVDITGDIGSDDANGAILRLVSNGSAWFGVRSNGATYDYYQRLIEAQWPITGIDADDIFEQKISATTHDLYLTGYTLASSSSSVTISSELNQSFAVADPSTAIRPITVIDAAPAQINLLEDVRIKIPSGFNMVWDTSITTVTVGGPAASKVATSVLYESGDSTVVVDVTTDFAAGDFITIFGLRFANFTANSASDNLELDIDADGTAEATDDKTIRIGSSGDTYYVRIAAPDDSGDGLTPATAWRHIDYAADHPDVGAGDWVYVGPGTYDEEVTPTNDGTASAPIRFIADTDGSKTTDPPGTVEITDSGGTRNVLSIVGNDYYEFVGFRLSSGTDTVLCSGSVGVLLQDCEIDGAASQGIYVTGTSGLTITGCNIHGNTQDGIWVQDDPTVLIVDTLFQSNGGDGVYLDNGTGATVTVNRCTIESNTGDGVDVRENFDVDLVNCLIRDHPGNQGVVLDASATSSTVDVWHCTIVEAADGIQVGDGTCNVRNCILANNTDDGLQLSAGTLDHNFDLVWGNGGLNYEGTTAGGDDVNTDPLFAGANNFRLQASSPAIDDGTDASSVTTSDHDNKARPIDAGWDMGCYEYGASGPRAKIVRWREVEPQ